MAFRGVPVLTWLKRIVLAGLTAIALWLMVPVYSLLMYGHEYLHRRDWEFASRLLSLPRDRPHSWPKEFDNYEFVCIVGDYGPGRYTINRQYKMNVPDREFRNGSANYIGIEHVWSVAFVNKNQNMQHFYIRQGVIQLKAEEGCMLRQDYIFFIKDIDGKTVFVFNKQAAS